MKQVAEWSDKVEQILKLFPVHIRKVMEQAEVFQRLSQKLEEIRVRVNQPLELVTADGAYFLNNGALVRQTDRQCLSVSEEDLRQMSTLMSRYSLYAYEEEIRQGFLTVEGATSDRCVWTGHAAEWQDKQNLSDPVSEHSYCQRAKGVWSIAL